MMGLMSSSDRVDVALLHLDQIGPELFVRDKSAEVGIVLVAVHTVDDDGLAIDLCALISYA